MGEMPNSDTPLSAFLQETGGGTAERASHQRRPFHSSEPARTSFQLDRAGAIETIAGLWDLAPAEPASWRLDRFGADLATSVEVLAGVVFSPHRGLVSGGPRVEIRVFPVVSDTHSQPSIVCVSGLGGPMMSQGIEDLADALPDPWGSSPETILDALEFLLGIAARIVDGATGLPAVTPSSSPPVVAPPLAHPIG